jgi:hypothetical protein
MVSALFTNPNWDSKDNDRTGRIKELNAHFNRAIELVYNPELEYENEPDWDNPREVIESDADEMGELLELEVRASSSDRARMRQGVDQLTTA